MLGAMLHTLLLLLLAELGGLLASGPGEHSARRVLLRSDRGHFSCRSVRHIIKLKKCTPKEHSQQLLETT